VIVNGKPFELEFGPSQTRLLAEVLALAGYDLSQVAVLVNGQVAPKGQIGQIEVQKGDALEIVSFVGGG
jgi:sulfur carrier protein